MTAFQEAVASGAPNQSMGIRCCGAMEEQEYSLSILLVAPDWIASNLKPGKFFSVINMKWLTPLRKRFIIRVNRCGTCSITDQW